MAITLGLDFGTHQTKICIENSDSPLHKTYEFYEWEPGVFTLPSIIQINKDHTLRYGSVDMDTCLVARKKKVVANPGEWLFRPKPLEPCIPEVNEISLPKEPIHSFISEGGLSISIPYSNLYGIDKAINANKIAKNDIKNLRKWEKRCQSIQDLYNRNVKNWQLKWKARGYPCPKMPPLPPKPQIISVNKECCDNININLIATEAQKEEYRLWVEKCALLKNQYTNKKRNRDRIISQYKWDLKNWNIEYDKLYKDYIRRLNLYNESLKEYPMIFRYFKQATFSSYIWDYEITAQSLTVLYLANIIFKLEERFGTNFSIQMGVPASQSTFGRLKRLASGYLIQAIILVEDIFHNDYKSFLSAPYEELISLIPKYEYSIDLKNQYGLIILPEAYAALRSLTANSRIPRGMSIMLDIGGGTTDISFFVIETDGEPHIYHFESIAKGLNFFLEYEDRYNYRTIDFSKKKELENIPTDVFNEALKEFKDHINTVIKNLTDFLHQDTISRGFMKSAFKDAVQNRPVVYSGGGCYDNRMRMRIFNFSDVKYIDKQILNIPNVIGESQITIPYSLMATAFGLSIQRIDDEIEVSKKEDLFAKYTDMNETYSRWNAHREHGMYED